ncbi:MAG: MFS transporter, partial [Alphaproteobacteria bacterium]|nr:MFS transporter [Alphaproteobacteria bacterium]
MGATIFGGICGGIMVHRYGVMKSLLIGGILQGLANLMYAVQAVVGHDIHMLMLTISIENVTAGMATTAFVAYLSGLCSVAYTATQYALLTSLMALSRDVISSTSGFIADKVDWVTFFIITALCALPGIFLLLYMMKKLTLEEKVSKETQLAEEAT